MANKTTEQIRLIRYGENLRKIRQVEGYNLFKGTTDFTLLEQFNQFESGYIFLFVVEIPIFLEELAKRDPEYYGKLISNFRHVLEGEFKNLSGLEDITAETGEISNGISSINLINKVVKQSATTVSMTYTEKAGSLLTKVADIYIQGIKYGENQVKRYHGLIDEGVLEAGPENEVFTFLYIVTDNTAMKVEQSYLLSAGQLTKVPKSELYNGTVGEIGNKEITLDFNCVALQNNMVDEMAQKIVNRMNDAGDARFFRQFHSTVFKYNALNSLENLENGTTNVDTIM